MPSHELTAEGGSDCKWFVLYNVQAITVYVNVSAMPSRKWMHQSEVNYSMNIYTSNIIVILTKTATKTFLFIEIRLEWNQLILINLEM